MRSRTTWTWMLALAVAGASVVTPIAAGATAASGFQPLRLSGAGHNVHAGVRGETDVNACADNVAPGVAHCLARVRTNAGITPMVGNQGAYDPAYLQSAYNAPSSDHGAGHTVAIIDAYDNPTAEADLAVYRSHFGLPACTTANGCFHKFDENGGTTYPAYDANWAIEIALDIDMVSALCPKCNILLVEAASASFVDLGAAENRAAAMGASAISNSYGTTDQAGVSYYDSLYYNHPGIPITVSSGDSGYGPEYPASSPSVVAVGGTSLTQTTNTGTRSATETAWSGAGSGCSVSETKPAWQTDTSCSTRTISDVSAVADPSTGVWVYSTSGGGTWYVAGGTSASAPIIAAFFAMAAASGSSGAASLYAHTGSLNDVASGSNGSCGATYLCTGNAGYDGPTGLGSPNGITAFSDSLPVPVNSAPPVISGTFSAAGGSASSTTGTWSDTPTSYAYQWELCDGAGANCTNIGTNANSYTPTNADIGSTLRVAVVASNTGGASTAATSNPTAAVVAAFAPVNTAPPTITNTASTNLLAYASQGTWTGSAETSHAFQWQQCDGSGNNCADTGSATSSTTHYDANDIGSSFRLEMTKTNAGGSGVGLSDAYIITAAAPTNVGAATIAGHAVEGRTLTALTGTWIGSAPLAYTYQWRQCARPSCAAITGATKATYVVKAADVGHTIDVRIRATNGQGVTDDYAAATAAVVPGIPLAVTAPAVTGSTKKGGTLTTSNGSWRGTATISATGYQWYRCNSAGDSCVAISGAVGRTYIVAAADKTHRLRARVYVKNPVGSANGLSDPTTAAT